MGITVHYIDNNWILQKRVLAFKVFNQSLQIIYIYMMLKIIFEEYKIDNKIFAIDFDNSFNNTIAISRLIALYNPYFGDKFFHHRCTYHFLNLYVQNGLALLQDYITSIRNTLHYL